MTGMRRGEILGLRWCDLDLDRARLSVRQALVAVGYEVVHSTPKSHGARVIWVEGSTRLLNAQGVQPMVRWRKLDLDSYVGRDRGTAYVLGKGSASGVESAPGVKDPEKIRAFIRAARKSGFTGTFYNVSFVGTAALAKELGTAARGVVVCQVMPFPYTPLTPVSYTPLTLPTIHSV